MLYRSGKTFWGFGGAGGKATLKAICLVMLKCVVLQDFKIVMGVPSNCIIRLY